jgi:hypothetical protein
MFSPLFPLMQVQPIIPLTPVAVVQSVTMLSDDIYNGINLNNDAEIQQKFANHFYKKLLNKWIGDYTSVLSYIKVTTGKVELIDIKDYQKDSSFNDDTNTKSKKIEFIEKFFLTENKVKKVLAKLCSRSGIRWVDLVKNEHYVKRALQYYLNKKIAKAIKKGK